MHEVGCVALDLIREALARRWITYILILISAIFVLALATLQLTVVDGVLAATRLFGGEVRNQILPVDLALRPMFEGASQVLFYGGTMFGCTVFSDFAPELLMPGRIEQLLALPLHRWQLVVGTYLGVLAIALACTLYAALLVTVLLGFKAGVWSASVVAGALAALCAFTALYGAMLWVGCITRSASQSAGLGLGLFLCTLTVTRPSFAALFDPGWRRVMVELAVCWLPRLDALSRVGSAAAGVQSFDIEMLRAAVSALAFGLACVALAIWSVERRDF